MKKLFFGILCGAAVFNYAQAQTQTIERQFQFDDIKPNQQIQHQISAVTRVFSTRCSSRIPSGQLILQINGKQAVITPSKITVSLKNVSGIPMSNGKNAYTYSILWKSDQNFSQSVSIACIGTTTAK